MSLGRQLKSLFKFDIPGRAGLWRFPENSEEGKKKENTSPTHRPLAQILTSQIPGALQRLGWPESQDPCPRGRSSAHRSLGGVAVGVGNGLCVGGCGRRGQREM